MKIIVLIAVIALAACDARDDSNPPGGFSGMTPLQDHATGCEYLARFVGLTPRIAEDGVTHRGCRNAGFVSSIRSDELKPALTDYERKLLGK